MNEHVNLPCLNLLLRRKAEIVGYSPSFTLTTNNLFGVIQKFLNPFLTFLKPSNLQLFNIAPNTLKYLSFPLTLSPLSHPSIRREKLYVQKHSLSFTERNFHKKTTCQKSNRIPQY